MDRSPPFSAFARLLHWVMAAMIVAMLFIGIGMVSSDTHYGALVAIHRPLGILILTLAAIRLVYRLFNPAPPLPAAMPVPIKAVAHLSHYLLYALMFAVPIVGWSMLSAGGYPIVLIGALHLPPIVPHDLGLYAVLREAHTVLAILLFLTVLAHLGAALMHAFVFRDGVFGSMATLRSGRRRPSGPA
ncbi:cytochrome b [Sphingomonas oryzagri]|uniref:Cytochrome b/b6 domain-containing protein n=1 Tax=Sphingomonas oryzagri TaxID=3042314 RepID=A0ABT6MXX9_9SPHN|nr:cytochrome b/b6 domain-containing protein [Sphingomonas oryzagri]MDH7637782.1 cytochrome b/b6 domain-containing protein [Sphingomonas oryzagri]